MIKNSRKSWIFSSKIQIQNLKFFSHKNPNDHVLAKSTAFQNQRLQQNTKWNTTLLKNVRMMFAVIFFVKLTEGMKWYQESCPCNHLSFSQPRLLGREIVVFQFFVQQAFLPSQLGSFGIPSKSWKKEILINSKYQWVFIAWKTSKKWKKIWRNKILFLPKINENSLT